MITFLEFLFIILFGIYGYVYPRSPLRHWGYKAFVIAFILTPLSRKNHFPDSFSEFLLTFIIFYVLASIFMFFLIREKAKHKRIKSTMFGLFVGWSIVLFTVDVVAMSYLDQKLLSRCPEVLKDNYFSKIACNSAEYYRKNFYYFVVKNGIFEPYTYNPAQSVIINSEKSAKSQEVVVKKLSGQNQVENQDSLFNSEKKTMEFIMTGYVPWIQDDFQKDSQ